MKAGCALAVLFLISACSDELDREGNHSQAVTNLSEQIRKDADDQVNQAIAEMGPVETPGTSENEVDNASDNETSNDTASSRN